jgi:hypothetical protein
MVSIQSANSIIKIEKKKDYSNRQEYPKIISTLHCLKTNTEDIILEPINGEAIIFPIGSFVKGAIYPICIKSIDYESDELWFMGYINS